MQAVEVQTVQKALKSYYQKTGRYASIPEIVRLICQNPANIRTDIPCPFSEPPFSLSDEDFFACLNHAPFPVETLISKVLPADWREIQEFNRQSYVRIYKHLNYNNQGVHAHRHFEITYVMRGSCEMNFETNRRILHAGDVCIISPGASHELILSDENNEVMNLVVSRSFFESMMLRLMQNADIISQYLQNTLYREDIPNYLLFRTDNSYEMRLAVKMAAYEYHSHQHYSDAKIFNWLSILLATLLRDFRHSMLTYQNDNLGINEDHLLLIQYLQSNYMTIDLDSLASIFNYNKTYLSRLIKEITGKTLTELIRELKLKNACALLLGTDMKIQEISDRCGFDNQNYFCKVFRKIYQMSPSDYRITYGDA